jgi:hypothetical protein
MSAEEGRLLNLLLRAPSDEKKEAAEALYKVAGQPAYAALADALIAKEIKKVDDLTAIIRTAGKTSYSAGAKDFARLAQEKNKYIRHTSIVTLEEMEDASVAQVLLDLYEEDKTPDIKKDILRALGPAGKGNAKAKELLLKELQASNLKYARASAIALAAHYAGNPDVREALHKTFIKTNDDLLQKSILYAYAMSRDAACTTDLDEMAKKERNKDMKDLILTVRGFVSGEGAGQGEDDGGGGGRRGGRGGDWRNLMRAWRAIFEDVFKDDTYPRNRDARELMRSFGMGL